MRQIQSFAPNILEAGPDTVGAELAQMRMFDPDAYVDCTDHDEIRFCMETEAYLQYLWSKIPVGTIQADFELPKQWRST